MYGNAIFKQNGRKRFDPLFLEFKKKNTPNFVKMVGKVRHVFLLPYFLVFLKASINNQYRNKHMNR